MKDIFTELYKKVLGFFQTQEKENTKEVGYNRLKLVLMQDRTNLTPFLLERMRGEMIDVLSKYVEMDKDALELNFEQEGDSMALMLSIPVLRAKEEEEIQAIIKAEEEAKEKALAEVEEAESDEQVSEEGEEEPESISEEEVEAEADTDTDTPAGNEEEVSEEIEESDEEQSEEVTEETPKKKKKK